MGQAVSRKWLGDRKLSDKIEADSPAFSESIFLEIKKGLGSP